MKFFYIIVIFSILSFFSCKSDFDAPCRSQVIIDSLDFSINELTTIPYGKTDSIMYTTSQNDTLLFLTQSINYYQQLFPSSKLENPECPKDYDGFKALNILLFDSLKQSQLTYSACKKTDSVEYSLSGITLKLPIASLFVKDSTYHDSLIFFSLTFYDVNSFVNHFGDSFYINHSHGIVRMVNNGKEYSLLKFNQK